MVKNLLTALVGEWSIRDAIHEVEYTLKAPVN